MSTILGVKSATIRKGLLRLIMVCLWLLAFVRLKEGAAAGGVRHWAALICVALAVSTMADFIVFLLTELNHIYIFRELERASIESQFDTTCDRVGGTRWNTLMAARKKVLQIGNQRMTFLCYAFGWLNPLVINHCHRMVLDWRWELKDWRGVEKSIWWTRFLFSKCLDPRTCACHVAWDYWKRGILPSKAAYANEIIFCFVWDKATAYLPFFLAAKILVENKKADEAVEILTEVNQTLKNSLLNDLIKGIQKNGRFKGLVAHCREYYYLDFDNCLALALEEQGKRGKKF